MKRKKAYLCAMYNKILCLALAFVLSLSVGAEDLRSVMNFYKPDMSKGFIFISKKDLTLTLVNSQGKVVVSYPIACGMNIGQKNYTGDHKTPEGYFLLEKIHDSANWGHDFHDGNGFIKHAYGPYFLRLQCGFQGIGIHGTHAPSSIGTRATEGCIRLENENVAALQPLVTLGMPVIIGPEEGVAKLIASNAQRPDLPYWTTGGVRPVKTAQTSPKKREPKVVDGKIDIDPELDLIDAVEIVEKPVEVVVEKPVEEVVEKPVEVVVEKPLEEVVEKPVEAIVEKPVETVIETPVEAVVETPVEEVVEKPVETVIEEVKVSEPVAKAEPKEPEPLQVEMVVDKAENTTSTDAPQYEVVVEEVTAPDGTVKYEVHYKAVSK
ncbi:MAG: L,D-transpeptidase [Bacteroidales bacterium]|nr:L,D-transpeptidase [Bacteroidales bacterium]